jgi:hypothetical protein
MERKQTNHWFVAYEHAGELRVTELNLRSRLRPGSKHLCGQTCLHKLVDVFMDKVMAGRAQPGGDKPETQTQAPRAETRQAMSEVYDEFESSARLITTAEPVVPQRVASKPHAEVVAMPAGIHAEEPELPLDQRANSESRNWRAEAWNREREREQRSAERDQNVAGRRRSAF